MSFVEELKTTAVASWFGSNRMLGKHVGEELSGCTLVAVPFAGGMSELAHVDARTLLVNDRHAHVVNLGSVTADAKLGPKLYRQLRRTMFDPRILRPAQERCKARDGVEWDGRPDFNWAVDYFVCCWMARNGESGKKREFEAGYSLRYTDTGGDSAVRFRSATRSLIVWRRILQRATFTAADAFEFLAKCKDRKGYGVYSDAPWPEDGDDYRHTFDEKKQRRLAEVLSTFRESRVVIRFGDHPLIRELYPEPRWTWRRLSGRTQANKAKAEVLILNGKSLVSGESESDSSGNGDLF